LEGALVPPPRASAQLEATHYTYRYIVPAAAAAAHQGDADAVQRFARDACAAIAAQGAEYDQPNVLCDLAASARQVGLEPLAMQLADAALQAARALGVPWPTARSLIVGALLGNGGHRGQQALVEALEITATHGFTTLWTHRERHHAAPLLANALENGLGPPGCAARLVSACGGEVLGEVAQRLEHAPAAARGPLAQRGGPGA